MMKKRLSQINCTEMLQTRLLLLFVLDDKQKNGSLSPYSFRKAFYRNIHVFFSYLHWSVACSFILAGRWDVFLGVPGDNRPVSREIEKATVLYVPQLSSKFPTYRPTCFLLDWGYICVLFDVKKPYVNWEKYCRQFPTHF